MEEPAFKWWGPHVIKWLNRTISKVKSCYWRTTHKFGICLPKSVEWALEINRMTYTDQWRKAINKAMSRVRVTWRPMMPIPHKKWAMVSTWTNWFPRDWMSHCFWYQDGLHAESMLCHWWSHFRSSELTNIFKCHITQTTVFGLYFFLQC